MTTNDIRNSKSPLSNFSQYCHRRLASTNYTLYLHMLLDHRVSRPESKLLIILWLWYITFSGTWHIATAFCGILGMQILGWVHSMIWPTSFRIAPWWKIGYLGVKSVILTRPTGMAGILDII